ncbi:MAG: hypothetical protein FWF71_04120 [Actinomycetia bacterium]|nr:hypothetical protein [Actinomycetes bacterium]
MDTSSYLSQLEALLSGLPSVERQNAVAYYAEYLLDAGAEDSAAAVRVLGTPESLAAQIKADVAMSDIDPAAWQTSFDSLAPGSGLGMPPAASPAANYTATPECAVPSPNQASPAPEKKRSTARTILIVILAIFALPIGAPLAIAIIALAFSLIITIGAVLLSILVAGLSVGLAALATIIGGSMLLFESWPHGLFLIGAGLIVLSLSLLFDMGVFHLIRLALKGIARMFNAIRKKLSKRTQLSSKNLEANHV